MSKEKLPEGLTDIGNNHWAAQSVAVGLASGMVGLSGDGKQYLPDAPFTRINLAHALGVLLTGAPELYATTLEGTLKIKEGSVSIQTAGGQSKTQVKTEITVKDGDAITTGAQSSAEINYPDGSSLLIKENTQISIVSSKGRKYLKTDGSEGTAVDWLKINLKEGTILGGLASRHEGSGSEQPANGNKSSGTIYKPGSRLIASLQGMGLLAEEEKEKPPWYKASKQKKVKIQVDMPWGVAAIRGTFFLVSVESNGQSDIGCLTGDVEVSNNGVTIPLTGNQSTQVLQANWAPPPPVPLPPAVVQKFVQEQSWLQQTVQVMEQVQEATPPPPPVAVEIMTVNALPGQVVPITPEVPVMQTVPVTPSVSPLSVLQVINQVMQTITTNQTPVNAPVVTTPASSEGDTATSSNHAPTAGNVTISGTAQAGRILTGHYIYNDIENNPEATSIYQWYTASTAGGTDKNAISVANSVYYTVTSSDIGRYIFFEVTPVASAGKKTGITVMSAASGPVEAEPIAPSPNQAPSASEVAIGGTATAGQTLMGHYIYNDVDGDPEGTSIYQWYRGTQAGGNDKTAISVVDSVYYTLTAEDLDKYVFFEVTPVASSGTIMGTSVISAPSGPVLTPSSNARLSSLSLSEGSLTPDFAPDILNYATTVAESVHSLTVFAVADSSQATVVGNGNVSLNTGDNPVNIVVTAQNGTTTITYTLIINRGAAVNNATIAVQNAETLVNAGLNTQIKINEAQTAYNNAIALVGCLSAGTEKTDLTARLTNVQTAINTAQAVIDIYPASADFYAWNSGTDAVPNMNIYLSADAPLGTYKLRNTSGGAVISTFEHTTGGTSTLWTSAINYGQIDGVKRLIYTYTPSNGSFEGTEIDDGIMPLSPTAAAIAATDYNSANYISYASKASPAVSASAGDVQGNVVFAELTDAYGNVCESPIPASSDNSSYIVSMADASFFADGDDVTVRAYLRDSNGNYSGYYYGTSGKVDFTLPVVSAAAATIFAGDAINVQSSEVGTVYLVPSSATIVSRAAAEDAVTEGSAVKTTISQANTDTFMSTIGLQAGTYKAIAIDAAGNLSSNTTGTIKIVQWIPRESGYTNPLNNVIWSGDKFVCVGNGVILTSTNGSDWTYRTPHLSVNMMAVACNSSRNVYVIADLTHYYQTSPDGINWNAHNSMNLNQGCNVVYLNERFIAMGYYPGLMTVYQSSSGTSWSACNPTGSTSHTVCDIAWDGTYYMVVGSGGYINRTPSSLYGGTTCTSNTTQGLRSIIWNGAKFVVVGEGGTILTSPDGQTWTVQNSGTTNTLCKVIWNGSYYVAVGAGGTILTSPDGQAWRPLDSGTTQDLCGITWDGSQFITVGVDGTILASQ